MADQGVVLDRMEWQAVLTVMGNAQGPGISWTMVNPLIIKIGQQLQAQEQQVAQSRNNPVGQDLYGLQHAQGVAPLPDGHDYDARSPSKTQ